MMGRDIGLSYLKSPIRPFLHDVRGRKRYQRSRRNSVRQQCFAVSKSELDELEMHIAIVNQKMSTAAKEDNFQEAVQLRDRLENLRLKHRLLQVKHTEGMRASICHQLGQVIEHRKYNYKGVIYGVHSSCQAAEAWIQTMHIDRLPLGRHQPFYQVLVDERYRAGGMITYVAQENIAVLDKDLDSDSPIQHNLIAQLFEGFDKGLRRYVPTQKIIEQYPDSLEARKDDLEDND